jgi:hypothetical protein
MLVTDGGRALLLCSACYIDIVGPAVVVYPAREPWGKAPCGRRPRGAE